jgi:hypothetical protein
MPSWRVHSAEWPGRWPFSTILLFTAAGGLCYLSCRKILKAIHYIGVDEQLIVKELTSKKA